MYDLQIKIYNYLFSGTRSKTTRSKFNQPNLRTAFRSRVKVKGSYDNEKLITKKIKCKNAYNRVDF